MPYERIIREMDIIIWHFLPMEHHGNWNNQEVKSAGVERTLV
jgi:hypothetical protein